MYKLLMHRSRVNSGLCLEKSGCSQTLIKVGGVLIYKWGGTRARYLRIKWPSGSKRTHENCSMRIV